MFDRGRIPRRKPLSGVSEKDEALEGMTERHPRRMSIKTCTKAKGRTLLRELALSAPIFRDLVRVPDHNVCHPGIIRYSRTYVRIYLTLL
jgi:hypothetical protein